MLSLPETVSSLYNGHNIVLISGVWGKLNERVFDSPLAQCLAKEGGV